MTMSRSLAELTSLTGRVALVTGGAGHIGRAICDALAEQGARVIAADQRAAAEHESLETDLRDEAATRSLVHDVLSRAGRLDVLVHCAAYTGQTQRDGWAVPFEAQSVEAWDEAHRVNTTAAFTLAQEAAPALRNSGRGSIILVSSIYGMVGPDLSLYTGTAMQNPAAYGASKAGLLQLGRYLATVLAPEIRVNALTPGGIWRGQPEAFVARYEARTPLGRMGREEDLKGAAAFLASDLSAYVTGQNLVVDGGWTAW